MTAEDTFPRGSKGERRRNKWTHDDIDLKATRIAAIILMRGPHKHMCGEKVVRKRARGT